MSQYHNQPVSGHGKNSSNQPFPAFTQADEEFLRNLTDSQHDLDPRASRQYITDGSDQQSDYQRQQPEAGPGLPPRKADKKDRRKSILRTAFNAISTVRANLPFIGDSSKSKKSPGSSNSVTNVIPPAEEVENEKKDLNNILDRLSLSQIQNRLFASSVTDDSAKLLESFKQVFKDLVNGVPTAYNDLENLLTNRDHQIRDMYKGLPDWLQKKIETLPASAASSFGPLAAMAGTSAMASSDSQHSSSGRRGFKGAAGKIPMLKNLAKGEAIIPMLRSLMNFLKLRLPAAVTGTSMVYGLAMFLLLFVFWYCHKCGREERLRKEGRASGSRLAVGDNSADRSCSEVDTTSNYSSDSPQSVQSRQSRQGGGDRSYRNSRSNSLSDARPQQQQQERRHSPRRYQLRRDSNFSSGGSADYRS